VLGALLRADVLKLRIQVKHHGGVCC
jgi:hypothetical protein